MRKATKEKKLPKNRKKINNKNTTQKHQGIFDYDQEVGKRDKKNPKLTRKVNNKEKKLKEKRIKENKKKIKKIKKNNINEKQKQIKEIKKQQKQQKQAMIVKRKPTTKKVSKQIQERRRNKKIVKNTIVFLLIISAILLLFLSPIFYIKNIKINGNEKITNQEIISLLKIGKTTNIFKETEKDLKNKLKENAYINIEETQIKKKLPDTIEISIQERKVDFLAEFANSFMYLDKDGYILEISTSDLPETVKITGYKTKEDNIKTGKRLVNEDISKINDVYQIINSAKKLDLYNKITWINIADSNDYIMYMESEKKTIYLGNLSNLDTKMLYAKAILEREKEYEGEIYVNVDLNKRNAYFKQDV